MVKGRPSHPRPLTLRFLSATPHALSKRVRSRRNLRVRTSSRLTKARSMHLRPLMRRFLTAPLNALSDYGRSFPAAK
ncbi:hypothetical protein DQM07_07735 [Lacticaseibacillus paracasei subsp. paracasei]|nr:hypothetical protein DQM07_07735 [Lacticaseibacillus paracasei subsp. paracasei]